MVRVLQRLSLRVPDFASARYELQQRELATQAANGTCVGVAFAAVVHQHAHAAHPSYQIAIAGGAMLRPRPRDFVAELSVSGARRSAIGRVLHAPRLPGLPHEWQRSLRQVIGAEIPGIPSRRSF